MLKQGLSIFFLLLFMATIIAPSVLILVDDSIDVSFMLDASEEEEEKGKGKNKELEVFVIEDDSDSDLFSALAIESNLGYTFKKYPKPHLNLISPPPEFIL